MTQPDNLEKAPPGTFERAVALRGKPFGTFGRSRLYAWSEVNTHPGNDEMLWPRIVTLIIKTPSGREYWEMVVDPDETVSTRRGHSKSKDAPAVEITSPALSDFVANWNLAETYHNANQQRRHRRTLIGL